MELLVVTGNIMKCTQKPTCRRTEVYRRNPMEEDWVIHCDPIVKKAVLIKISDTEYIDVSTVRTSLGLITKMALKDTISCYPKEYGDVYVEAETLKPYYKNPRVNVSIHRVKRDMKKYKRSVVNESEKVKKLKF